MALSGSYLRAGAGFFDDFDAAAGGFDRGARALGRPHVALHVQLLRQLAREDDLGAERLLGTMPAACSAASPPSVTCSVSGRTGAPRRLVARKRVEAALGQPAMQRHLAALEADLVVAARARALALVAQARGLAPARADAAADAVSRLA